MKATSNWKTGRITNFLDAENDKYYEKAEEEK